MTARRRSAIVAAAVAVAVGAALWWAASTVDAERLAASVRALGPLGPLVLLVLLVGQCVVAPLPSEPLMMAAGFLYGPGGGFGLSWAGVVLGAAVCFGLARRLGRPFAERFVRRERLDAADAWVRRRGRVTTFAALLAIRMTAFGTFDVLSYACGLVEVRFAVFLVATVLGAVPKVFAFSYAGATFGARPGWVDGLILAGTFGVLGLLPWLARRRRPGAAATASPLPP